jgi:hypothetical protein
MVFSIVVSRWRLRAIFALRLPGLRLYFYTKIERRSFHTAWTRSGSWLYSIVFVHDQSSSRECR